MEMETFRISFQLVKGILEINWLNGSTYSECDGFGPRKGTWWTRVVGHANGETVVTTVRRQQIFAGALEIENATVKSPVMRITENGANCVIYFIWYQWLMNELIEFFKNNNYNNNNEIIYLRRI